MIYEKEFGAYFSKLQFFTFKDATRFLKKMGASDPYIKLFMHNQIKRHQLLRLSKGNYTFNNSEEIIGFAFSPFYYGLEYSLTLHRLWTQMANPVIITTTSAVPGTRQSMGHRIIIRRISKKMFFGIERIKYNGMFIPVSDVEKTLIDFIYYKITLSKEDLEKIIKACDRKKLHRYIKTCNRRVKNGIYAIINANPTSAQSRKKVKKSVNIF